MGGGYTIPSSDAIDALIRRVQAIEAGMRDLQAADASQQYNAVVELKKLVENLAQEIEDVSESGATWKGPVNTSGNVRANAGMRSVGVYNNLLTSAYRVQYIDSTGDMGYVPSSRQFKQDEAPAPDVKVAALALEVVTFRYREAVTKFGDAAAVEWGVIAEDIHDLGLTWAVDYDADGNPFGVKYDRLVLALFPLVQDHETRLTSAGL